VAGLAGVNTDQDTDVVMWVTVMDRFANVSIINCNDDGDGFGCGDKDGSDDDSDMLQSVGVDSKAPDLTYAQHPTDFHYRNPVDDPYGLYTTATQGVMEWWATDEGNGHSGQAGGVNHRWWNDNGSVAKDFDKASNNETVPVYDASPLVGSMGGNEQIVCRGDGSSTTPTEHATLLPDCAEEGDTDTVKGYQGTANWIPNLDNVAQHYWNVGVTTCDRAGNCVTSGNLPTDHVAAVAGVHADEEFLVDDEDPDISSLTIESVYEWIGGDTYQFEFDVRDNVDLWWYSLGWYMPGIPMPLFDYLIAGDVGTGDGDFGFFFFKFPAEFTATVTPVSIASQVLADFGSAVIVDEVEPITADVLFPACVRLFSDTDFDGNGTADDFDNKRMGGLLLWDDTDPGVIEDDPFSFVARVWDQQNSDFFEGADEYAGFPAFPGHSIISDDLDLPQPTCDDTIYDDFLDDGWGVGSPLTHALEIQWNQTDQQIILRGQASQFVPTNDLLDALIGFTVGPNDDFEEITDLVFTLTSRDDGSDPNDRIITIQITNEDSVGQPFATFGLRLADGHYAIYYRYVP
jgi:hypothetical protein